MTHSFFSSIGSGLITMTAALSLPNCSRFDSAAPADASSTAIERPGAPEVEVANEEACVRHKVFADAASCSRHTALFGPGRRFSICSNGAGTTLQQDQDIQGVKCPAGSFVSFYKSGRLHHTHATSPDQVIQGIKVAPRNGVDLYENGHLQRASLAADTTIQGLTCLRNSRVSFHENGQLSRCERIASSMVIQGLACGNASLPFSMVDFYANGRLKRCEYLSADAVIQGMRFLSGKQVEFHENGQLELGVLAEETRIQGIVFPQNSLVIFEKSGKLHLVVLGADTTIEGKKCEQGMNVSFSQGIRCLPPASDRESD